MSETKTAVVTGIVGELVEGVSARTGAAYRFQSVTILQKARNQEDTLFLKDDQQPYPAGKYEFDVVFGRGKDGRKTYYLNSPRAI
ncbi:hypothetical protein [Ralstonia sp. RRA.1]|uniref:hypothetical protein n=1 Tax=Ralstonia sp. RRA TaxID=3122075 RepID=UPI0030CE9AF8